MSCAVYTFCVSYACIMFVYLYYVAITLEFISVYLFFFLKHKTAYELRISDWSSDVCSSDLRRDDRQHRQHPQRPLHGEAGARRDEGEGEAQNRGRHPGEDGQHQRVPGDAAGIGADEAVESPDPAVGHAREEGAERVAAVAVAGRGDQDIEHREKDEGGDQGNDAAERADHEDIALDRAARGEALGEEEQQCRRSQDGAVAEAELAAVQRPEQRIEETELPAVAADREGRGTA